MPVPFATQTDPLTNTGIPAADTSGGGDTPWFIHEQTLGFSWQIHQESLVGSTNASTSSLHLNGSVAVNEYIVSSYQFSASETQWHTLSGTGYSTTLGVITDGQGYVYTTNPGYYRRAKGLTDRGSGCTGSFSFTMDPAQLDIQGIINFVKVYASIPANGGCAEFESWLINY